MQKKVEKIFKSVKNILFADPKDLYKKEGHLINQPFYFEGGNNKAVLLVHGWTSTPYEVRRLGVYLNENGYTVHAPMLRGHGTVPKDLENVRWEDWLEDISRSYEELSQKYEKVFVAGTSIGSNLAMLLAEKNPNLAGLVLMATPYRVKMEKIVVFLTFLLSKIKKYKKKFYPPTFGVSTTVTRLISYQSYPTKNSREVFKLVKASRENLPKVIQPCFVIQSNFDHVVSRNSLEEIYKRISSKTKEKKYIEKAYHTFISDIKNEHVFSDILEFLDQN